MNNSINKHWNFFYKNITYNEPSNFSKFIIRWLIRNNIKFENKKIIDVGCGNGRDSNYFYKNKFHVTGFDLSKTAINNNIKFNNKIKFVQKDICKDIEYKSNYNFLYAMFFIHAITEKQQKIFFNNCNKLLSKKNSFIFLEFRTIKDPLIKKGKKISKNERVFGHYRRFIDVKKFKEMLINLKLNIVYSRESYRFAIYNNEVPHISRIIIKNK